MVQVLWYFKTNLENSISKSVPTLHIYSDLLKMYIQNFRVTLFRGSAVLKGPLWYHCKVAGTTLSSFIGKTVQFLGLNLLILLTKIGKRAREGTPYSLISQVSLGIFEAFYEEF